MVCTYALMIPCVNNVNICNVLNDDVEIAVFFTASSSKRQTHIGCRNTACEIYVCSYQSSASFNAINRIFSLSFVLADICIIYTFFVCVCRHCLCAQQHRTLLKRPWKHNRNSILSRLDILFVVCRHSYYFYFARTFIIVHRYAVRDIWANMGRAKYTHGFWRTEIR